MNVYRRYFRIESGPLFQAIDEAERINSYAQKAYGKIIEEIGAEPGYYHTDQRLFSLVFKGTPDRNLYKKKGKGWYPKKNIKKGKELAARIEDVKTKNVKECLSLIGLPNSPMIFTGSNCYYPTLVVIHEKCPVIYVSVPWYDEDPEKLDQYIKDNKAGVHCDTNLDSVRWKPTEEMKEIKSWEMDKHIDEWNEKIKSA